MDGGGYERLSSEAQHHIHSAHLIIGPKRHLSMLPDVKAVTQDWPVPFSDGIELLLQRRGSPTVMLVSGDPFWFGAGSVITRHLDSHEWLSLPGHSCFSLAASEVGWPLEDTICIGLHAAPLSRLRPHLAPHQKIMATLRDGDALYDLMTYLSESGFGETQITCLEALGRTAKKITTIQANDAPDLQLSHPVMVALLVAGEGRVMPRVTGLADDWFDHDGQITKQPIRALTLAALAPCPSDYLWDLGAGSGSIAIEWLLSSPSLQASAIERNAKRAQTIRDNARSLGVNHLEVIELEIEEAIETLPLPDCIFIGGGLKEPVLHRLWDKMAPGTRLVANGVTLETEQLLIAAYRKYGGSLSKFETSHLVPIGTMQGWKSAFPITQWSVTK